MSQNKRVLAQKEIKLWIKKCKEYTVGHTLLTSLDTTVLNKLTTEQMKTVIALLKSVYSAGCEDVRVINQSYREVV